MKRVNINDIEFTNDYLYLFHGVPYTGIGFELDSDGRLISEVEFQNGMQHGITKMYYPLGRLQREAHYRYNTLHGFVREWTIDGVLELEEEYELGICLRRKVRSDAGELQICYEIDEVSPQYELLQMLRKAKFIESRK